MWAHKPSGGKGKAKARKKVSWVWPKEGGKVKKRKVRATGLFGKLMQSGQRDEARWFGL